MKAMLLNKEEDIISKYNGVSDDLLKTSWA